MQGTELARQVGVEGYYARMMPPDEQTAKRWQESGQTVRAVSDSTGRPAEEVISPDALALVRFGLREPDDLRILNTVEVIDAVLKVDTDGGPAWRRYNGDQYGEHEDGSAFDGNGIGRAWPLLAGERGPNYELLAGRHEQAQALLHAVESFAFGAGMLPEQVWDADDIPEHELYFGKASGSVSPLSWAHAKYLKLYRSLHDRRVFDLPSQTVQRYLSADHAATH